MTAADVARFALIVALGFFAFVTFVFAATIVGLMWLESSRCNCWQALVRRPEIYLFDDSFSALDYSTDAALRTALAHETTEATVVIVAQRVNTIRDADRILVLDDGQVVGTGTHTELMHSNETYREIVLSQLTEEEAA
jgi:ABC-type multidrug transport system fused ATPase/permease subunit